MTYSDVYKSCIDLFLDNWTSTEIEQEGIKLKMSDLDKFSRIRVYNDDASNYSHGETPRRLLTGHVIVELYVRRGNGPGDLLALTDECDAIFSNVKLPNGIKFQACEIIDHAQMISGETVTDPNWISKSVIAKFKAPL